MTTATLKTPVCVCVWGGGGGGGEGYAFIRADGDVRTDRVSLRGVVTMFI